MGPATISSSWFVEGAPKDAVRCSLRGLDVDAVSHHQACDSTMRAAYIARGSERATCSGSILNLDQDISRLKYRPGADEQQESPHCVYRIQLCSRQCHRSESNHRSRAPYELSFPESLLTLTVSTSGFQARYPVAPHLNREIFPVTTLNDRTGHHRCIVTRHYCIHTKMIDFTSWANPVQPALPTLIIPGCRRSPQCIN